MKIEPRARYNLQDRDCERETSGRPGSCTTGVIPGEPDHGRDGPGWYCISYIIHTCVSDGPRGKPNAVVKHRSCSGDLPWIASGTRDLTAWQP
jgi:hypothetical protein